MMNYIREPSYYDDLYDLLTVQECLRAESLSTLDSEPEGKLPEQKIKKIWQKVGNDLYLYYKKGERYQNKSKVIADWKLRDQQLQDIYDHTLVPRLPYCNLCNGILKVIDKILIDYDDKKPHLEFMVECQNCNKKSEVNEDGSFRVRKPKRCIKCSSEVTTTYSRTKQVITTTYSCSACGYAETDTLDLSADDSEYKKRQAEDRELLDKYRSKYCLSEKEGQDFVRDTLQIEISTKHFKELTEKKADPSYQVAQSIKKSSIVEIETLINKSLDHTGYTNLSLDKPEIDRYVIVPFTILESKIERSEWNSKHDLQKLLIKTLEPTNWRLMSAGISYRMGYLSGKLKAYETTDDLMKMVKQGKNLDETNENS
jgi:hypothetical protein